ncbi:hypothetical protein ACJZ2D_007644 [Fusarium nematophilum]
MLLSPPLFGTTCLYTASAKILPASSQFHRIHSNASARRVLAAVRQDNQNAKEAPSRQRTAGVQQLPTPRTYRDKNARLIHRPYASPPRWARPKIRGNRKPGDRRRLLQPPFRQFFQNRYILQTPENETISLEIDAIIHYENNALHGFRFSKFATTVPHLMAINYNTYVVEVESSFNTGVARAEVFEIKPCGRRDGKPIEALLPPGGV